MPSLLDSGKVVGDPASVREAARRCGLAPPISVRGLIAAPGCTPNTCVRLHIKVLPSSTVSVPRLLARMRQVYATAGLRVVVVSRENLTGSPFTTLTNLNVGTCKAGDPNIPTADQIQLFQNRNNVGNDEVVAYFVQSTNPVFNGCATHPNGQPGAVITNIASQWTLAHEIGHVLGLDHISGEKDASGNCITPDFTRLMTGCSTSRITVTPTLVQSEITTMINSNLTNAC